MRKGERESETKQHSLVHAASITGHSTVTNTTQVKQSNDLAVNRVVFFSAWEWASTCFFVYLFAGWNHAIASAVTIYCKCDWSWRCLLRSCCFLRFVYVCIRWCCCCMRTFLHLCWNYSFELRCLSQWTHFVRIFRIVEIFLSSFYCFAYGKVL